MPNRRHGPAWIFDGKTMVPAGSGPRSAGSLGGAQRRQFARWLACLVVSMLGAISVAPAIADVAEAAVLEVFVRSDCPHCADAKVFLAQLARDRPGVADRLSAGRPGPAGPRRPHGPIACGRCLAARGADLRLRQPGDGRLRRRRARRARPARTDRPRQRTEGRGAQRVVRHARGLPIGAAAVHARARAARRLQSLRDVGAAVPAVAAGAAA